MAYGIVNVGSGKTDIDTYTKNETDTKLSAHNESSVAHADIRERVEQLFEKIESQEKGE